MAYCGQGCKEDDALGHNSECAFLRRSTSDTARLMLRLLARVDEGGGEELPGGGARRLAGEGLAAQKPGHQIFWPMRRR